LTVSDTLSAATAEYKQVFGHPVPAEVVQMFELRPGPLMMEIRQAVALGKPVPAWLARWKVAGSLGTAEWNGTDGYGAGTATGSAGRWSRD